jgi:hypothetical protein
MILFDYYIWVLLQMQFMGPARIIARNDAMEEWLKLFKPPTICKQ